MRVLITGGFGFVGSKLIELLSYRNNLEVTVIDNLMSGSKFDADVTFIEGDIRDVTLMDKLVPRFDVIIHLAAIVGEPACVINPQFAFSVNVSGTRSILKAMRKNQRIIFTSTSSVYGNRPNEVVTEDSQPLPINNYAQHKYQSELDIQHSGVEYIIVRPVTAFGITRRTRLDLLVNTLIYDAITHGHLEIFEPNIMRPIIHVNDFASILEDALYDDLSRNEVYNIGDPFYNMTKLQLATKIADLCGATIVEKDGVSLDPRNYDVSFHKLMASGILLGGNRLELAVQQIYRIKNEIALHPESFSTPYKVQQFLLQEIK